MNRILYIGRLSQYGESSTCVHRLDALKRIGYNVDSFNIDNYFSCSINNRIRNYLFKIGFCVPLYYNKALCVELNEIINKKKYDIIWIDKGLLFDDKLLKSIKEAVPKALIIGYSPDDMTQRHNISQQFYSSLPFYDVYITTKSYIVDDLKRLGVRKVYFIDNSYNEMYHYPRKLSKEDLLHFQAEVSFIGSYEKERANSILYLAQHDIPVSVYCNKWKIHHKNIFLHPAIYNESFCKSISASKINLCFLRKINRDLQTTRSIEIPACGGFMLAERTKEHLSLFKEDVEAVYFSSDEELLSKCKYFLSHAAERKRIAKAGYQRCIENGYSNTARLQKILEQIENDL